MSAAKIIQTLAEIHELTHRDGRVNQSAMSRRTGIPQPTVQRILTGEESHAMGSATLQALVDAFGISFDQARGNAPITKRKGRRRKPSDADIQLLEDIKSLPVNAQDEIKTLIRLRKELLDHESK